MILSPILAAPSRTRKSSVLAMPTWPGESPRRWGDGAPVRSVVVVVVTQSSAETALTEVRRRRPKLQRKCLESARKRQNGRLAALIFRGEPEGWEGATAAAHWSRNAIESGGRGVNWHPLVVSV